MEWPAKAKANDAIFSAEEKILVNLLTELGQQHLFDAWESAGQNDSSKHEFFSQIHILNNSYPGGLASYIYNARNLLRMSKDQENPLSGWTPEIPTGVSLEPLSPEANEYERMGSMHLSHCGFILVAGGLGERLGYNGIKVSLPSETTTNMPYLKLYCHQILAFQKTYCSPGKFLPLAIMVSDDTLLKTISLLEENEFFGMRREQVTIMKQEKVAALLSTDAKIAQSSPYEIDSKPHGHGDVHTLMHSTGTAAKWLDDGIKYCTFFQDTNGLCFNMLAAMLGVSEKLDLEVNSLAVPRFAKQAVGAITRLVYQPTKAGEERKEVTINVEYNQLDPLLRATVNPDGDVNDAQTGLSPYPGNINQLVFRMDAYCATLARTGGLMPEFVNPKYADASRDKFKKPTRLECMMQDYPKALGSDARVGFTLCPAWVCYSPCKNNSDDAAASVAAGVPAGSAFTAESDQYAQRTLLLQSLGVHIQLADSVTFLRITASPGPRIVFDPSFAVYPSEVAARFPNPSAVRISARSTLILAGDIIIHSLSLDGALRLVASPGTRIVVDGASVENRGHVMRDMTPQEAADSEVIRMRGYVIEAVEEAVGVTETAGDDIRQYTYDGILHG